MTTYQHKFDFGDDAADQNDPFGPEIADILKKVVPTEAEIAITCDRVRRIVEATEIATEDAPANKTASEATVPAPAAPARVATAQDDRWAELRQAPPEPEPEPEPLPEPEFTAGCLEHADTEISPPETPPARVVGKSSVSLAQMPEPVPAEEPAPTLSRTSWDTPADHEMGRKGKMAWRIGVYGTILAVPTLFFALSPFAPKETAQHHVSAMGCQFAALFDFQNIKAGEPGYHAHLDPDADGIACEVQRQRISLGGGGGFKRP